MKELIRLENVHRFFSLGRIEVPVLKGVNLQINEGDFVSIMGPSGSGKSTLLHLIGLLDSPSSGEIFFENSPVTSLSEKKLSAVRGRKIGFVFQQFNLFSRLTALENVVMPMIFANQKNKTKREERALALLKKFGLEKRADHKPTELSGGEQQRVAIARALANNPKLIVADEPTGNLDSKTGRIIMETIQDLWREEKKTVIIVTHDPEVASLAQKTIHIKDGQIEKT